MTGHLQILQARQNGFRPAAVFVEAGLSPRQDMRRFDRYESDLACGAHPSVHIPAEEMTRRPDLRFLAGCRVHLHGQSMDDQLMQMAEWIAEAGASEIIVASINDTEIVRYADGNWEAWPT